MYKETLISQWDNLCSDFAGNYDVIKNQGDAVDAFQRWYEARVHRWFSTTYSEGLILEQKTGPEFAGALKEALSGFRFVRVSGPKKKNPLPGVGAGALLGGAASGGLLLTHMGKIKAIIGGVVLFAGITSVVLKKNGNFDTDEKKRVKDAYVKQLTDYQDTLIKLCGQYGID